ncbi:MAG TPA: LPS export ABC transporter periplasmic protein LptC [Gammaproteobacteria bacterium]|jgi:lipopolysaccharide export system protein LptC|nr:LPS export ABC transporter periplasmic protein LptC [Gammaproteobacteria bacterium]
MTHKHTFITFISVLFFGAVTWLTFAFYQPQTLSFRKDDNIPDAIMEDVTAVVLDKQGKPKIKIMTPKMVHFKASDRATFITPELIIFRNSPNPWRITSKYAEATQGASLLTFWDSVTIHHAGDLSTPTTLIQTQSLIVHVDPKTAETADPITLNQPHMTIKATGMFADMNTGSVKLLTQARGEYVPTN